jgi:hypothetical protein
VTDKRLITRHTILWIEKIKLRSSNMKKEGNGDYTGNTGYAILARKSVKINWKNELTP